MEALPSFFIHMETLPIGWRWDRFADGAPWHFLFAEGKATGACRAEKLTEVLWGCHWRKLFRH